MPPDLPVQKGTLQLSAFSGNNFFSGFRQLVNEGLPNFIVNQLRQQQKLRDKVVAVLGMAFKGTRRQRGEPFLQATQIADGGSKGSALHYPYVVDQELVPLGEAMRRADVLYWEYRTPLTATFIFPTIRSLSMFGASGQTGIKLDGGEPAS